MMGDKWAELFDVDELPGLFKNVEQAKRLGEEGFANVLMEAAEEALEDDGLPHLLTGLIIGNVAFGANPNCSIALSDTKRVFIEIREAE